MARLGMTQKRILWELARDGEASRITLMTRIGDLQGIGCTLDNFDRGLKALIQEGLVDEVRAESRPSYGRPDPGLYAIAKDVDPAQVAAWDAAARERHETVRSERTHAALADVLALRAWLDEAESALRAGDDPQAFAAAQTMRRDDALNAIGTLSTNLFRLRRAHEHSR